MGDLIKAATLERLMSYTLQNLVIDHIKDIREKHPDNQEVYKVLTEVIEDFNVILLKLPIIIQQMGGSL